MKIWIDMATAPQVLLLCPIIGELQKRGYELFVTTRHSTETVALADRRGLLHTTVGFHGGGTLIGKGGAIVLRAIRLIWLLKRQDFSVAISHSSYSQALAAGLMRIPFVALTDYEGHPGMRIVCRVAKRILVPHVFSKENLYRLGASEDQVKSYNGLKEDVYLAAFTPDPMFLEEEGIPADRILVTMRPASEVAAYHQFRNPLFDEVINYVSSNENTFTVILPRTAKQRQRYKALGLSNVLIPDHVLDGPNLIYYSDLVVGAGGTVNREATVLGTPVYTMFKGGLGSVDQHLIRSGKMVRIEDSTDFSKIEICKKPQAPSVSRREGQDDLVNEVIDEILEVCM